MPNLPHVLLNTISLHLVPNCSHRESNFGYRFLSFEFQILNLDDHVSSPVDKKKILVGELSIRLINAVALLVIALAVVCIYVRIYLQLLAVRRWYDETSFWVHFCFGFTFDGCL